MTGEGRRVWTVEAGEAAPGDLRVRVVASGAGARLGSGAGGPAARRPGTSRGPARC